MSLVECNTAADVWLNVHRVRKRMRALPFVRDDGINLTRKASVPEPEVNAHPARLRPVTISAPELAFVFEPRPTRIEWVDVAPIHTIQNKVAGYFGVSLRALVSHRREAGLVWPRHIAMYLCKIGTTRSLPQIARQFGDRDHSTICYGTQKIARLLGEGDPVALRDVGELKRILNFE